MPSLSLGMSHPSLAPWAGELQAMLAAHGVEVGLSGDARGDLVLEEVTPAVADTGADVLAVPRRGDPRDAVLVSEEHATEHAAAVLADPSLMNPADPLRAVASGATVGAVGAFRCAQIAAVRPDLDVVEASGTCADLVEAWLAGSHPVVVVGAAALDRTESAGREARRLDAPWFAEAGAGALWVRGAWTPELREALLPLDDRTSRLEIVAELAVQQAVDPPAGVLLGVSARVSQSRLELAGLVLDPAGGYSIAAKRTGEATMRGTHRAAAMLARDLEEKGIGGLGAGRTS
ncbi:MAG: hypothetical protein KDA24_20055 [Deltaproteobacteria bacterium]|nr:hypothetical protein [Deltaproteobacteria bacterium]